MRLFSKRNRNTGRHEFDNRLISRFSRIPHEIVSNEIRNRLISEIRFLSSGNDFLEWFILFDHQINKKIYFDKDKIDHFSLSELGYKMSDYFEFENFAIVQQVLKRRDDKEGEEVKFFDDYRLFDLVEIVILFAKKNNRQEVINRFNAIFIEETADFQIIEHLITRKSGESLKMLVTLLKDENLKSKINTFFDLQDDGEYVSASKISADIVNIIFSGFLKEDKVDTINEIKEKLCKKAIKFKKAKDGVEKFSNCLDSLLKSSKLLSNEIYDIRHTEKSTIEPTNNNIYKLVSNLNISLAELVLTTLKDDYVLGDNWEKIKNEYIKKYRIDKNSRLAIKKPAVEDSIKLEDIPF
jgi:hypothetical protein